jgi:hypothetical protein
MHLKVVVAFVAALAIGSTASAFAVPSTAQPLNFSVSFPSSVRAQAANGRVYVIVSRAPKRQEPRFQIDIINGVPFWGRDVQGFRPGRSVAVGAQPDVYGYPLTSIDQLPAGDYTVQAFLNVYTTFHRSDGSVVQLHMPCGDGGYFLDSPGNLYSTPVRTHLDPASSGTVALSMANEVQPSDPVPAGGTCQQGNPSDSMHVKHVKIRSKLLTAFWGRPIYLGADVLLPEGYDPNGSTRYPIVWHQDHYPFENPYGFSESGANDFSKWWLSTAAPRVIVVDIRHENPYFDDSYAVNSANLGPYGDAITKELMPFVERHFHAISKRWARVTEGGSTGGWEAIAQQVFYPDLYSGAWIFYPDPLDFRFFQLPNIYADTNAYVTRYEWVDVPRPSARAVSGDTYWTMGEENHWELALGTHGRSQLGQWDIWQAVYGPQGSNGYPAPIWDKVTGAIDHSVARAWQPMDLRRYLQANWPALGPKLQGQLKFFVGDDDTFFLNNAVQLMQGFLQNVQNPPADATFRYGRNQPHGWSPYTTQQLVTIMAEDMANHAPAGTNTSSWLPSSARVAVAPGSHVVPQRREGRVRPTG